MMVVVPRADLGPHSAMVAIIVAVVAVVPAVAVVVVMAAFRPQAAAAAVAVAACDGVRRCRLGASVVLNVIKTFIQ